MIHNLKSFKAHWTVWSLH